MKKPEENKVEITPIEQGWQEAFKSQPQPETHLAAEAIVELAQKGKRCLDYDKRMDHIVYCTLCRELLQNAQEAQQLKPVHPVAPRWPWILAPTAALATAAGMLILAVKPIQQERDQLAGKLQQVALAPTPEPRIVVATPAPTPRPTPVPKASPTPAVTATPRPEPTPRTVYVAAKPVPLPDLDTPALTALSQGELGFLGRPSHGMGKGEVPVTIRPLRAYQTAVDAQHPLLLWERVPEAKQYQVTINFADDGAPLESGKTESSTWNIGKDFQEGTLYEWFVEALDETGKPIARSPFCRILFLTKQQQEKAQEARKRWSTSPIRLAQELASLKLFEEALAEVERYQRSHPNSPKVEALIEQLKKRGKKLS